MSRCEFEFLNLKAPLFYIEVLSDWKRFKGIFIPLNAFHVRKEFIWFNPFIKIDQKSIFYRSWFMKGIRFINDIVDDKGDFLSHDAINKKYNLNVTFVDILSIKLAIPRDWKDFFITTTHVTDLYIIHVVIKTKNPCLKTNICNMVTQQCTFKSFA